MQTAAGGGSCGGPPCGDGGQADDAELSQPRGVTSLPDGGYLVTDSLDHRVRRVLPDGRIVTVAGSSQGLSGDGGPATAARLSAPTDTAVLPDGSFLIADTANHRIRHVGLDGRIRTVAGTTRGFSGDGGPATAAQLDAPSDIAVLTTGGYVIADTANSRLRRVDLAGNITTLAGTGPGCPATETRPATLSCASPSACRTPQRRRARRRHGQQPRAAGHRWGRSSRSPAPPAATAATAGRPRAPSSPSPTPSPPPPAAGSP